MKFAVDDLYYKYYFCATRFKYGNWVIICNLNTALNIG